MKTLKRFFKTLYWAYKVLSFNKPGRPWVVAEFYHVRQTLMSGLRALRDPYDD